MADLRIVDAPLIPKVDITGLEKIPTGGSGNCSISLDGIAEYTQESLDLADKTDVLNSENGVKALLKQHTDNLSNPHVVTKDQVGLGNVDNTADADKPMSNLTQSTITTLDQKKADKTSVYLKTETYNKNEVDSALANKPNSNTVYTKIETNNLLNGKVSSVNGKNGTAITLTRSDLGISSDEVMQQWLKEARFVEDESGLNQQQINNKLITSVDSIADLIAITNPKDGRRVFVNGLQGDYFVYYASKVSVNDGIFIFNGWVRQQNKYKINARYLGLTGDINQDVAPLLYKFFIYMYVMRSENGDNTHVELYFPTGNYKSKTLQNMGSVGQYSAMIYLFPNLTICGDGDSSVLVFPSNVMDLLPTSTGRYVCFWAEIACINTAIKDLKVDFDASTNYHKVVEPIPNNGKAFIGLLAQNASAHKNVEIQNVTWFECASYNVIQTNDYAAITSGWLVEDCKFIRCGDKANPLNMIKDHSSIYMNGKDKTIRRNKFITTEGSVIGAGIELHGDGEVYDNYFENIALPFHAVAEEDSIFYPTSNKGGGVSNWYNNTAINAMYGLSHNFRDSGNTVATFTGNYISLRTQKSSTAVDGLLYLHSAYESSGGINQAQAGEGHAPRIYLKGNTFEQMQGMVDWTASDMQINHCMNVKNVWLFEATDNTFIGFKGSILQVLQQTGENVGSGKTRIILKGNTYIDCGFDMFNGYNTVAYKIQGDGVTNATLGSLYTENETFIDCKYDYMLGTAKSGIVMNKVVIDAEIKSGLFITPYFDAAGVTGTTHSDYRIKYKCASRDNLALPSSLLLSDRYGLEYVVKVDNTSGGSAEFRNLTIHKNVQQNTHFIDVVGSQAPSQLDSAFTMYPATVGSKATIENPLQGNSLLYSWLYADARSRYEWVGTAPITVS